MVVETGMLTELGRIADLLQRVVGGPTPLQRRLYRVGKELALGGVAVALLILLVGLALGERVGEMILSAISVAVAVIPEGLPAVVTVTLALGAQRMLRRQALIRKLPAVETLGSVTIICSDKTGTLTQNRMTVTVVEGGNDRIEIDSSTAPERASFEAVGAPRLVLTGGALCNDARVGAAGEQLLGDPTETALVAAAARAGLSKTALAAAAPRVAEVTFDSSRKRMTTVHRRPSEGNGGLPELWSESGLAAGAGLAAVTKGATDAVLEVCERSWRDGRAVPLDPAKRERILEATARLAQQGLRVLAVGMRPLLDPGPPADPERALTFVGLRG